MLAEILEFAMYEAYEAGYWDYHDTWEMEYAACNAGQQAMADNYLRPEMDQVVDDMGWDWPEVEPWYLYDAGASSHDRAEPAFSDIMTRLVEGWIPHVERGLVLQELMYAAEFLEFF